MIKPDTISDFLAYGDAIVERIEALIKESALPAAIKAEAGAFKKVHAGYRAACKTVQEARNARDQALAAVGSKDTVLDGHVRTLADDLVGARLGDRRNPFRPFSPHSPSQMVDLPYALEHRAVAELVGKIKEASPPPAVVKTLGLCRGAAAEVEEALRKISGPQAAYDKALRARDDVLPDWLKMANRLDKVAAAAWIDAPASHKALMALPESVQRPVRRRKQAKTPRPAKAPEK